MKVGDKIRRGVYGFALFNATISVVFASEAGKFRADESTEISPPEIEITTTTSLKSLLSPPPNGALLDKPDAIVTSSTSRNDLTSSGVVKSPWSLRFDSIYYGASITDPGNPNAPNDNEADGGFGDRIFVRNVPQLGYFVAPGLLVGAVTKIDIFPTHNVDYAWNDTYVRVQVPKLVNNGAFTVLADLRVYFPTAAYEKKNFETLAIQGRFVLNYAVPDTKLTIGSVFYQTWTAHSDGVDGIDAYAQNAFDSEIYAGPNMSYQLTPTLAFTLLYEVDGVQLADTPFGTYISDTHSGNGYTDLEPGLSWDVTPNINISPFLNMYPGSNFSLDTTSINVWFSFGII